MNASGNRMQALASDCVKPRWASSAVDVMPYGLDPDYGVDHGPVRRPIPVAKSLDDVLLAYEINGCTAAGQRVPAPVHRSVLGNTLGYLFGAVVQHPSPSADRRPAPRVQRPPSPTRPGYRARAREPAVPWRSLEFICSRFNCRRPRVRLGDQRDRGSPLRAW